MGLSNPINFGSVTLDGGGNVINTLTATKVPGTLKGRLNGVVTMQTIPGRSKEWEIVIEGTLGGGNRDGDESTLNSYDDGSVRGLSDGLHDGNYIIVPGTLTFPKENRLRTIYPFRMTLRQYTQTV